MRRERYNWSAVMDNPKIDGSGREIEDSVTLFATKTHLIIMNSPRSFVSIFPSQQFANSATFLPTNNQLLRYRYEPPTLCADILF